MAGLKFEGQKAIDFVAQHGGWLRLDGKMVSLAAARKADASKVTGGPRTKRKAKPAAEKKPKAAKPKKPKAEKKPKTSGIVAKIAKIKRLVNQL